MAEPIFQRDCGILLHPTSLPGPYGIGDLGPNALRFLDLLHQMGQSLWQFLPLNPPDETHSPYQGRSAFASDVRMLSLEDLWQRGLLQRNELASYPTSAHDRCDFALVDKAKLPLLERAAERLCSARSGSEHQRFAAYCEEQDGWLRDYAWFTVLRRYFDGRSWTSWPADMRCREASALARFDRNFAREIGRVKALQYLFDGQFAGLRRAARELGIRLIGDLPIFVAHDSADVWCHQDLFLLDPDGEPSVVAGVPPDYFSETGQRWGNPLYDWEAHRARQFDWWIRRVARVLAMTDVVRIDHFRGFAAYWQIPADCPTAVAGKWVPGPGPRLFEVLNARLGAELPIIAEDLGLITDDVTELKLRFGFPGMRVVQFSFGGNPNDLPNRYPGATVAYTGTHDNDTLLGWYRHELAEAESAGGSDPAALERLRMREFFGIAAEADGFEVCLGCIRGLFELPVQAVVVPLQDVLAQGSETRMNVPGTVQAGNWSYRFAWEDLDQDKVRRLAALTEQTGRGLAARRAKRLVAPESSRLAASASRNLQVESTAAPTSRP